jgi:hypothetical protein
MEKCDHAGNQSCPGKLIIHYTTVKRKIMGTNSMQISLLLAILLVTVFFLRGQILSFFADKMNAKSKDYRVNRFGMFCPQKDSEWPEWAGYCTVDADGTISFWADLPEYEAHRWLGSGRRNFVADTFIEKGGKFSIWKASDASVHK